MKKNCVLICSLFILAGCLNQGKKQAVCLGYANGSMINSILSATGNHLNTEIYEERTNLSELGFENNAYTQEEKQQVIDMIRDKKYTLIPTTEMEGITYAFSIEENDFVFTLSIDYDKASLEDLESLHFIENTGFINLGVSLSKTIESYEASGMKCK